MLGHTDPRLTLRIYAGVLDEMRERTADALDEMMRTAANTDATVVSIVR